MVVSGHSTANSGYWYDFKIYLRLVNILFITPSKILHKKGCKCCTKMCKFCTKKIEILQPKWKFRFLGGVKTVNWPFFQLEIRSYFLMPQLRPKVTYFSIWQSCVYNASSACATWCFIYVYLHLDLQSQHELTCWKH